ncbi:MAG TPA: hypothetical protein VGG10_05265 [Rhizomicrobium sp.]|jgi:hypothetical protein
MRFLAWLTAAVAVMATWAPVAHVLELPNKVRLDGASWLMVQQHLYNGWGLFVGAPTELGGLLLSGFLAIRTWKSGTAAGRYSAIAAAMYAAMLACFFLFNDPVNRALNGWTTDSLPADWTGYRFRWELGHALAALFAICALVAVALSCSAIERRSVDSNL